MVRGGHTHMQTPISPWPHSLRLSPFPDSLAIAAPQSLSSHLPPSFKQEMK